MQITIQVKSNTLGDSVFEITGDSNIGGTQHQHVEIADLLSEVVHAVCQIYGVPKNLVNLKNYIPRNQKEPSDRAARTKERDTALAYHQNTELDANDLEPENGGEYLDYSEEELSAAIQILQLLKSVSKND